MSTSTVMKCIMNEGGALKHQCFLCRFGVCICKVGTLLPQCVLMLTCYGGCHSTVVWLSELMNGETFVSWLWLSESLIIEKDCGIF